MEENQLPNGGTIALGWSSASRPGLKLAAGDLRQAWESGTSLKKAPKSWKFDMFLWCKLRIIAIDLHVTPTLTHFVPATSPWTFMKRNQNRKANLLLMAIICKDQRIPWAAGSATCLIRGCRQGVWKILVLGFWCRIAGFDFIEFAILPYCPSLDSMGWSYALSVPSSRDFETNPPEVSLPGTSTPRAPITSVAAGDMDISPSQAHLFTYCRPHITQFHLQATAGLLLSSTTLANRNVQHLCHARNVYDDKLANLCTWFHLAHNLANTQKKMHIVWYAIVFCLMLLCLLFANADSKISYADAICRIYGLRSWVVVAVCWNWNLSYAWHFGT